VAPDKLSTDFMIPRAIIKPARALYIAEFQRVVVAMGEAHVEPALRQSDGTLATDGELQLPYRMDLLPEIGGPSVMVDSPIRAQIEPREMQRGPVQVSVTSFVWDYANISILGLPGNASWEPLRQWFLRWFDTEDEDPVNEEGLYGVAHFMSDPKEIPGGVSITIDFGSAPIESFDSLVHALVSMCPRRVEVG